MRAPGTVVKARATPARLWLSLPPTPAMPAKRPVSRACSFWLSGMLPFSASIRPRCFKGRCRSATSRAAGQGGEEVVDARGDALLGEVGEERLGVEALAGDALVLRLR